MSYINPEFQLVKTEDRFISLLYYDKTTKTQGIEKTVVTDEIKDYLILPWIDAKFQLKKMEQRKFDDNKFHLAVLDNNRRLTIDEDGNLKIESV